MYCCTTTHLPALESMTSQWQLNICHAGIVKPQNLANATNKTLSPLIAGCSTFTNIPLVQILVIWPMLSLVSSVSSTPEIQLSKQFRLSGTLHTHHLGLKYFAPRNIHHAGVNSNSDAIPLKSLQLPQIRLGCLFHVFGYHPVPIIMIILSISMYYNNYLLISIPLLNDLWSTRAVFFIVIISVSCSYKWYSMKDSSMNNSINLIWFCPCWRYTKVILFADIQMEDHQFKTNS